MQAIAQLTLTRLTRRVCLDHEDDTATSTLRPTIMFGTLITPDIDVVPRDGVWLFGFRRLGIITQHLFYTKQSDGKKTATAASFCRQR